MGVKGIGGTRTRGIKETGSKGNRGVEGIWV